MAIRESNRLVNAGAAVVFGLAASLLSFGSQAALIFTIDPSSLNADAAPGTVDANAIGTTSSTLVTITGASTISGSGWLQANSFTLDGNNVQGVGPGTFLSVWGEFEYTAVLTNGEIGTSSAEFSVTSLSFDLFGGEALAASRFTSASSAGAGTAATVDTTGLVLDTDYFLLGTGNLLPSFIIPSSIDATEGGGSAFNGNMDFELTSAGTNFFIAPIPFFNGTAASLNNTVDQFVVNADAGLIAISAGGTVTFSQVPVPATLALVGFGLIGLGGALSLRRRQSA